MSEITPWDAMDLTVRLEVARELTRRACDSGGCLYRPMTCLMRWPDTSSVQNWCSACLMAAGADIVHRLAVQEAER